MNDRRIAAATAGVIVAGLISVQASAPAPPERPNIMATHRYADDTCSWTHGDHTHYLPRMNGEPCDSELNLEARRALESYEAGPHAAIPRD